MWCTVLTESKYLCIWASKVLHIDDIGQVPVYMSKQGAAQCWQWANTCVHEQTRCCTELTVGKYLCNWASKLLHIAGSGQEPLYLSKQCAAHCWQFASTCVPEQAIWCTVLTLGKYLCTWASKLRLSADSGLVPVYLSKQCATQWWQWASACVPEQSMCCTVLTVGKYLYIWASNVLHSADSGQIPVSLKKQYVAQCLQWPNTCVHEQARCGTVLTVGKHLCTCASKVRYSADSGQVPVYLSKQGSTHWWQWASACVPEQAMCGTLLAVVKYLYTWARKVLHIADSGQLPVYLSKQVAYSADSGQVPVYLSKQFAVQCWHWSNTCVPEQASCCSVLTVGKYLCTWASKVLHIAGSGQVPVYLSNQARCCTVLTVGKYLCT
jgi:hypothetical protein